MPPIKASGDTSASGTGNSTMHDTATSPAPDEMPTMCGSARRLRVMPCRIAPDIARLAPTMAPTSTRGRRIWRTITSAVEVVSLLIRARQTCAGLR